MATGACGPKILFECAFLRRKCINSSESGFSSGGERDSSCDFNELAILGGMYCAVQMISEKKGKFKFNTAVSTSQKLFHIVCDAFCIIFYSRKCFFKNIRLEAKRKHTREYEMH